MHEIKRKLYRRGSSYETTVPMPLLFALDKNKKYNVVFSFDAQKNKWQIDFDEIKIKKEATGKNHENRKSVFRIPETETVSVHKKRW